MYVPWQKGGVTSNTNISYTHVRPYVFSLFNISSSNSDRDCFSTAKEQSFRTIRKRTCAKETNLTIIPQRFSAVLEQVGWLALADRSSLNRGQPCQPGTAWPLSSRRQASRENVGAARKRWQKRRHALIWDTVSRSRASRVVSRLCQYGPKRAASTAATRPTKVCLFLLAVVRSSRSTRYRRAIPSFTFTQWMWSRRLLL